MTNTKAHAIFQLVTNSDTRFRHAKLRIDILLGCDERPPYSPIHPPRYEFAHRSTSYSVESLLINRSASSPHDRQLCNTTSAPSLLSFAQDHGSGNRNFHTKALQGFQRNLPCSIPLHDIDLRRLGPRCLRQEGGLGSQVGLFYKTAHHKDPKTAYWRWREGRMY